MIKVLGGHGSGEESNRQRYRVPGNAVETKRNIAVMSLFAPQCVLSLCGNVLVMPLSVCVLCYKYERCGSGSRD